MAATAHPVAATAAGSAPPANSTRHWFARSIALWHLMSLDAPSVAMVWTWFLARSNHIALPATAVLAMGIAVWMLYAADRLLDSRAVRSDGTGTSAHPELEARHYFHRNHQAAFRLGILVASIALALLLPALAPRSIRLYLVLGTLLLGYFVLIHASISGVPSRARRLPKELAVGVFFSAATFIPAVTRAPALRPDLLPGAVLFAVLCSLNCLFIYSWEHSAEHPKEHSVEQLEVRPATHPATRLALRFLPGLAVSAILAGVALSLADRSLPWPISAACALAACFLLALHRNRDRFLPTTLRAAADLCLLTPLLLLPF